MIVRLLILLYALISYTVSLVSFVYALGFVGNVAAPKTIDVGGATSPKEAIIVDIVLLGLFAMQHSIMARPSFKKWWTRIIPATTERSTYVLLSSLILLLLFWQWRPIPAPVWQAEGAAALLLAGLYWIGWVIVLVSTFMIDHFDMFGLRQAFAAMRAVDSSVPSFQMRLLYRVVRHPIMLGFLIAFWATPVMTMGHLLFAIMTTGYILVALQFEERDLITAFGEAYARYRAQVPMLAPFWPARGGRPRDLS